MNGGGGFHIQTEDWSKGYIHCLGLVYVDAKTLQIKAGQCRSDDDLKNLILSAPVNIDITDAGVNGLDAGSEAPNTWYYVWIIHNLQTRHTAGLFSTSMMSPTLPAGYTKKRRIGTVRNDSLGNFIEYVQRGCGVDREYTYFTAIGNRQVLSGGTAQTPTPIDLSSFVPPNTLNASLFSRQQGNPALFIYQSAGGSVLEEILARDSASFGNFPTSATQTIAYANAAPAGNADIFVRGYLEGLECGVS